MRHIDLQAIRPYIQQEITALDHATTCVLSEADPVRRANVITRFRRCWIAVRGAFSRHSFDKCWYIECKNPGADDDIDHFRPKASVKEDPSHPGYYWLAFDWTNLRLSCHHANRPRRNPTVGQTGGKSDHFPLIHPATRARTPSDDISREEPALIDPTNRDDVALLSFQPSGDAVLSPSYSGKHPYEERFRLSNLYLNLNLPKFRDERLTLYNEVVRLIERASREAPRDVSAVHTAHQSFMDACDDLVAKTDRRSEYSAAAIVYVNLFQDLWWVRDIVLKLVQA